MEMLQTLETSGTVREARGLASRYVNDVVGDGVLNIHQSDHAEFHGNFFCVFIDRINVAQPEC